MMTLGLVFAPSDTLTTLDPRRAGLWLVSDGDQVWDLTHPGQREAFTRQLQQADRVVVPWLPTCWSSVPAAWWDCTLVERALRLGESKDTLLVDPFSLREHYRIRLPLPFDPRATPDGCPHEVALAQARGLSLLVGAIDRAQACLLTPTLRDHVRYVEMPAAIAHAQISQTGIRLDESRCRLFLERGEGLLDQLERTLKAADLTEPHRLDHVQHWIRHTLKVGDRFQGKIDDDALKAVSYEVPIIATLRKYRRVQHLLNQGWLRGEGRDSAGLYHPRHTPLSAPTGRTATSDPSVTSLPKACRPLVVPRSPDRGIIELDYASKEIAVAATRFNDRNLQQAYATGDAISFLCKKVFFADQVGHLDLVTINEEHEELRGKGKIVTYGDFYGRGAESCARQLGINTTKAGNLSRALHAYCPAMRAGMDAIVKEAKRTGIVPIWNDLNRRLTAEERSQSWRITTIAKNTPIQGLAGVIFRVAMSTVQHRLRPLAAEIILPMHDSLVIECPVAVCAEVVRIAREAMQQAFMAVMRTDFYPFIDVSDKNTSCWNKKGKSDSLEWFLADPTYKL
jgi:hypothetical protein